MVWLDEWYGGKLPVALSLAVIGSTLAVSIAASLLAPRRDHARRVARSEEA